MMKLLNEEIRGYLRYQIADQVDGYIGSRVKNKIIDQFNIPIVEQVDLPVWIPISDQIDEI